MKALPQQYNHLTEEKKWQQFWEEKKLYQWEQYFPKEQTFVIDTPPPTVSGLLHMGHIFSYTQADFVARYQRMKGKTVFYPMGFDDNGLPTERLVEKVKNIRGANMPRAEFIAICKDVVQEAEEEFRTLFRSVALSVDWSQEYQTISPRSQAISQLSFLDLFDKERAYRSYSPTLWDPIDQTALAQADIEDKEMASIMNDITFIAEDGSPLIIATTRPELLAACVAVFYHPDDSRYTHLKGKTAVTPLFGVKVPLLADDLVSMEKGTGLVMCCTFGDDTDVEWWRKHKLQLRVILDKAGRLNISKAIKVDDENFQKNSSLVLLRDLVERSLINLGHLIPQEKEKQFAEGFVTYDQTFAKIKLFDDPEEIRKRVRWEYKQINKELDEKLLYVLEEIEGLKVKPAREKIIGLLKEAGALGNQTDIIHNVKCAERSGAPLEILVTVQWFVKVLDQKEALLERSAECNWQPPYMKIRLDNWINGLTRDWCISRQRFFGVPFPVWYSKRAGEEGKILVARQEDLPVDPLVDLPRGYSRDEVIADQDVMDTWATSSVSPQLSSHGISDTHCFDKERHSKLFPADMRPQAHEIIRSWAFYTIVKAHLHEQTVPWKNLMISGWCLASDKTKMSKSKGNVVTPVHLIEEKGSDVVRYWASTSRLGADTAYSEDVLKIGKKLVNKVWNAAKFASLHLEKLTETPKTAAEEVASGVISETLDLWVLTRLRKAIAKATEEFERFEYSNARVAVEDFFWNDFCDNYLEIIKTRAYDEQGQNKSGQMSAVHTIYHCLDGILRLFAPFIPHITEELYSAIFAEREASIHARGNWLNAADFPYEELAEKEGMFCVQILNAVRKAKADKNLSMKAPILHIHLAKAISMLDSIAGSAIRDLESVTNAALITVSGALLTQLPEAIPTEDNSYQVQVLMDEKSDAA